MAVCTWNTTLKGNTFKSTSLGTSLRNWQYWVLCVSLIKLLVKCLFLRIKQKCKNCLSGHVLLQYVVVRTVLQSKLRSAITAEIVTFMTVGVGFMLALTEILHFSKKAGYLFNQNCRTM